MRLRSLATVAVAMICSAPLVAQHVVFEEDFENGIPPTWTRVQRGQLIDPWRPGFRLVDRSRDINHEWYCSEGLSYRDNLLLSPPIDLTEITSAYFECGQWQMFPDQREYNAIEVTTDGGMTYRVLYEEAGTWSGFGTIKADMSAYLGMANVQVALHYRGFIANDWSVDNVRITTSPLAYEIENLAAGQTTSFAVSGAVPGNAVLMLVSSTGAGPAPTPWGNLGLTDPVYFLPVLIADSQGEARLQATVPAGTAGRRIYGQAIEFTVPATIRLSNSVAPLIQ